MKFGTRKADVKTDFNGTYLRAFRVGDNKVRFLEEPDEWILFQEHFTSDMQSFPCSLDTMSCPGCTSDDEQTQRRNRKYATFVYLPENNVTLPFKVPMQVANSMTIRAEKNDGTITNRDYIITRSGKGLKTTYEVDSDERYSLNIPELRRKADVADIEEVLNAMYNSVWGETLDAKPTKAATKEEPKDDDGPPPWETKKTEVPDEIGEDTLRAMSYGELINLWNAAGFEGLDEDWSKNMLVEQIIKRAE